MELIELREEVGRLRRAICEERAVRRADLAALWFAVEVLQQKNRIQAAPEPACSETDVSRHSVSQGQSAAASVTSVAVGVGTVSCLRDVAVQTDEEFRSVEAEDRPVQTDAESRAVNTDQELRPVQTNAECRPTESSSCNIYFLENQQLKHVLQYLDCKQLLRARRVCKRWRSTINDLIEDYCKTHQDSLTEDSVPVSDLHMYLIARENPGMTKLQVPGAPNQGRLDLCVVAYSCENLASADLRSFTITGDALSTLVNKNGRLEEIKLPGGCSQDQLRPLSQSASLRHITLNAPNGDVTECLPKDLKKLYIGDLEIPLEQCLPQSGLPDLKNLELCDCRGVTDLASLPDRAPALEQLCIFDSPGITAGGLQHLGRLKKLDHLWLQHLPVGVNPHVLLQSLSACTELTQLYLGDFEQPTEVAISAAAISRLAVVCRKLFKLWVHTTAANAQAVLDALLQADLGSDSRGRPRAIEFIVPEPACSKLRKPPSESRITLWRWVEE